MPIGHGHEHRSERHRGLSCADVALKQAIHRLRVGEILRNFAERAKLIRREREGKPREDFAFHFRTDRQCWGTLCRTHSTFDRNGKLQHEQFVVGKPRARRRERSVIGNFDAVAEEFSSIQELRRTPRQ